ncbi:XRE family transcriptional regulator [Streptomyces yaizuensis]|uniref:Helix-turn-helix domain-containing protein n=1 Tax=Streptomyces yaizuensis TaxID=2989713 RepID=A0ABQ5P1V6_9ACTN|nr:XRE family transcriptional regulator [Streptomyces sp. YSPA8]GLF96504.1 helix-turn-helix domain-containing protein [Streptomyces sp. YSPA8]
METNATFVGALREKGFTQGEAAEALNAVLRSQGHGGTVSDRTVRHWSAGKTRWPHLRQREALETVFGCTVEELGFTPPARRRPDAPMESPVRRRIFLSAATGTTTAAMIPFAGASHAVGTSDVLRLRSGIDELISLDNNRGGHEQLERAALAGAEEALRLQQLSASQRVRRRLFGVASEYTVWAAWSAVDAQQAGRAVPLLHHALYLAGMAQDPVAKMKVWNNLAMAARQRGDYREAFDAGQAALSVVSTRQYPLLASLAHARIAVGHGYLGERQAALRSFGHAQEALEKVDPEQPQPGWIAFYGPGDLAALTAVVHEHAGEHAEAEAASHRAFSATPPEYRRNRAMDMARIALAQLRQHDVEQACATATASVGLMNGDPLPGRMRAILGDFQQELIALAPTTPVARDWRDRHRAGRGRA